MSKSRKNLTPPNQLQLNISQQCGRLDQVLEHAANLLSQYIRDSRLSREQICDRLSVLLGHPVPLPMLNAWTARTNKNRMPADVFAGLCFVLDAREALDALIAPLGWKIAMAREQAFAELGKIVIEKELLAAREARARRQINGGMQC